MNTKQYTCQVKSSQVKSSQVNLLRFFPGAVIAFLILLCGTAFADLAYVDHTNGGRITIVDSSGTSQLTEVKAVSIFPFIHNGSPRILTTYNSGNISIYDPSNLSAPLSSGNIDEYSLLEYVAELGSNLVLAFHNGNKLIEIDPSTCETVNTYSQEGYYPSYVYPYGGQIVVALDYGGSGSGGGGSYTHVSDIMTVTMDRLGHITGQVNDIGAFGLETSGGELYFPLGAGDDYDDLTQFQGIYRVSGMLGNMNTSNAVRVTTDNPNVLCRDGNGGLYYSVFASGYPRYIYHWNGSSSTRVYDAGNNAVNTMYYDINSRTIYAGIITDYASGGRNEELTALRAGSSGQLEVSQSFGVVRTFSVVGNPADGSSGGTVPTNPTQPQTPTQTTTLPSGVIEPAPALSRDVLEKLAALVSIDVSAVNLITSANISEPQDPTQSMLNYIKNDGYEAAYKFNTLTVSNDGYYVFMVNIPEELVGTKVSDVKLYAMKHSNFAASFFSLINGVLNYGEITNLLGVKIDSLEGKVLAIGLLQAGTPFSVYLAKIILALLTGGCSLAGAGITILLLAGLLLSRR